MQTNPELKEHMTPTKPKRRSRNFSDAVTALRGILSQAETYQLSSHRITEKVTALRERFNLTQTDWSYLRGYEDAIRNSWQYTKLVHCYIGEDGKPYDGVWNQMSEEQRQAVREGKRDNTSGHFWKGKDGGIGRPYFVSKEATRNPDGSWKINEITEQFEKP